MSPASHFVIPDLIRPSLRVPFGSQDIVHLDHDRATAESKAWLFSWGIFAKSDRRKAAVIKSHADFCAVRAYPYATYEYLRTTCDWMNVIVSIDEITDVQTYEEACHTRDTVVAVLRDPSQNDGTPLSKMIQRFVS